MVGGQRGWVMTAFTLSTVGTGIGLYLGRKVSDHYGY